MKHTSVKKMGKTSTWKQNLAFTWLFHNWNIALDCSIAVSSLMVVYFS